MEDALRVFIVGGLMKIIKVLILVLMEDALRVGLRITIDPQEISLNPCSNGRCSARAQNLIGKIFDLNVLILVLMEDALREFV